MYFRPALANLSLELLMNKTVECLINIMAAALNARPLNTDFEGVDFPALLRLADFHRIDIPMYYALKDTEGVPKEILNELKNRQEINSLKFAVTGAETDYLNSLLEKEEIPYMLLKGSVIRDLYPHPDMRTSCDVDYLVNAEDMAKIERLMADAGFTFASQSNSVDTYKKPPFVCIEVHTELMGGHEEFDCLHSLWENALPLGDGVFGKKMSHDDFYAYSVVHIAKHLTVGGSGIRPLMDMYLYLKNYENTLNWEYIYSTLATVGLDTLGRELKILCEHWFCGGDTSDVTPGLSRYIVNSGIFGTTRNAETQREVYRRSGAKISKRPNFLRVAFLSYKNMTLRYPSLKTPLLLPLYWVIRIFDVLLHKREKIAPLLGNATEVSQENVEKTQDLFARLNIIRTEEN